MGDHEATTTAAIRIETIINPANGQPVKVSEATAKRAATTGDSHSFIVGYQHRLADEWNERHAKPRRYTVRFRGGEFLEPFTATSHSDQGEWILFYGMAGEALMVIKQADVIAIWSEPIEAA